jgi:GTP cyclohydrolase II
MIAPLARPSSGYLTSWSDLENHSQPSTPGIPTNLLSPQFTPPSTPGLHTPSHAHKEPKSTPVDTTTDPLYKSPRLLERLPLVECVVRARIPTTSGAEMFLHLYQNDSDNKEHLAIVFGNTIRSASLDAERPNETEMDRMIRGAYTGRLRPGRVSSRIDGDSELSRGVRRGLGKRGRSGSALKNVVLPGEEESIPHTEPQPEKEPTNSDPEEDTHPSSPSHTHTYTLKPPLVRIHSECYTGETAWSARCDCGEQLDEAARLMSLPQLDPSTHTPIPDSAGGVIVYLRQEGRGIGLASKLKAYNLQDLGNDTVEANLLLRHPADARSYGLATSILCDLGLGGEKGIRLLTNNPDKVRAVEGPGREVRVRERVAMVPISWKTGGLGGVQGRELEAYLQTKIGRMGHMIKEEEVG